MPVDFEDLVGSLFFCNSFKCLGNGRSKITFTYSLDILSLNGFISRSASTTEFILNVQ